MPPSRLGPVCGEVLHAHEEKNASAVIPFLEALKRAGAPLRAVAMDMSEEFANAVRSVYGSTVDIVHDPFHVVALASEAIDETQRDLVRSLSGAERKGVKGTRFLLLKGLESLTPGSLERPMLWMAANEPLSQAYLRKEDPAAVLESAGRRCGERVPGRLDGRGAGHGHRPRRAARQHARRAPCTTRPGGRGSA